jgi:hypothetical protein
MGQGASGLPFNIGTEDTFFAGQTSWKLFDGTAKVRSSQQRRTQASVGAGSRDIRVPANQWPARAQADGAKVSIFAFEVKSNGESRLQAAKNHLQRLKTLRHPHVLKFIDGVELPETLYVVTEAVRPLDVSSADLNEAAIALGLRQLCVRHRTQALRVPRAPTVPFCARRPPCPS